MVNISLAYTALLIAIGTGIVSSIWLLRISGRRAQILLNRQLWHQAVAKLAFYLIVAGLKVAGFVEGHSDCLGNPALIDGFNIIKSLLLRGFFFASWTAEVHIAAGIWASAKHDLDAQKILEVSIRWIWIVAVLMDFVVLGEGLYFNKHDTFNFDPIGAIFLLVCLLAVVSLYCFAIGALRNSHAPEVAIQRTMNRALAYPTIFIVTALPSLVRNFNVFGRCEELAIWSAAIEDSVGLWTALAFWVMNPQVVRSALQRIATEDKMVQLTSMGGTPRAKVQHTVGFSGATDEKKIAYGSWRKSFQWAEGEDHQGPGHEFRLTLDRRKANEGRLLGFVVEDSTWRVLSVAPDGLVADWNAAHPDRALRQGDLILEINGRKTIAEKSEALKNMKVLDLIVFRDDINQEIWDADELEADELNDVELKKIALRRPTGWRVGAETDGLEVPQRAPADR